jgi:DNA-binding Xre family transcriptional regulator
MTVSYKKLWHLLIDKDLKKNYLHTAANLSSATISKLNRGENVNTDILVRICKALSCDVSDIMEILPDDND